MIEPFWLEVAKQIPSLGVLVWLVISFLRHLKEDGDRRERLEEARAKSLKEIGDSCHAFQQEITTQSHAILARNTAALDNNSAALGWHAKKLVNGGGSHV